MPATSSVKIEYISLVGSSGKPEECEQSTFIQHFRKLVGTGKPFGINVEKVFSKIKDKKDNHIRTKVTLQESGKMTAADAAEYIAKEVPSLFPLIAKYERVSSIKTAMTLDNLFDGWRDVVRKIFFMNRDKYSTTTAVEEDIVKHYRLAFNQDDTEIIFNGTLFGKIAARVLPQLEDEKLTAKDRGMLLADLLHRIASNDKETMDEITSATKSKNGRTLEPLVKKEQKISVSTQAKKCYISYTPAIDGKEAEYRFSTITDGQSAPGRNGKLENSDGKTEYLHYYKIANAFYDRTRTEKGKIAVTAKSAPVAVEVSKDGFSALATKTAQRVPLTESQQALVDAARKKFSGNTMLKMPKTDHGVYQWALKAKANGLLP